jgi:hypothetical protein
MSSEKKIRGDATLKLMPPDRQREIWEKLNAPDGTLAKVRKWLIEDGIKVSLNTLSEFYSWYGLRLRFQQAEQETLTVQDLLRQAAPELPEEKVHAFGEAHFNIKAIRNDDEELYLAMRTAKHKGQMDKAKLALREREVSLKEKTWRRETCELFLEWFADARARDIAKSEEPDDGKVEKLGKLIFGEDWN